MTFFRFKFFYNWLGVFVCFAFYFLQAASAAALPGFIKSGNAECSSCHINSSDTVSIKKLLSGSSDEASNSTKLKELVGGSDLKKNENVKPSFSLDNFSFSIGKSPTYYYHDENGIRKESEADFWYRLGYDGDLNRYHLNFGLFMMDGSSTDLGFFSSIGEEAKLDYQLFGKRSFGLDTSFAMRFGSYYLDLMAIYTIDNIYDRSGDYDPVKRDSIKTTASLSFNSSLKFTAGYKTYIGTFLDGYDIESESSVGIDIKIADSTRLSSWYINREKKYDDNLTADDYFVIAFMRSF